MAQAITTSDEVKEWTGRDLNSRPYVSLKRLSVIETSLQKICKLVDC